MKEKVRSCLPGSILSRGSRTLPLAPVSGVGGMVRELAAGRPGDCGIGRVGEVQDGGMRLAASARVSSAGLAVAGSADSGAGSGR